MFISVLIVILACNGIVGERVYHCDQKNDYANYMQCLNKWRVVNLGHLGHSAFLKDVSLIDEICINPRVPDVKEMDKCVINAISPYCDSTTAHWKGLKQFVNYICKHREAFEGSYARCRTSKNFQSAYENCMATNVVQISGGENNCRSYRELGKCLKNALANHCSPRAAEFFILAFSARDDPLRAITCKGEEVVPLDYVSGTGETKDASNEIEKQSTENSPMISRSVQLPDESLAVNESNGSDVLLARLYCILIAFLWRLFISYLAV